MGGSGDSPASLDRLIDFYIANPHRLNLPLTDKERAGLAIHLGAPVDPDILAAACTQSRQALLLHLAAELGNF